MPSTVINARRLRWAQIAVDQDFSGGPNVRDAPIQLAPNECLDAWNVDFDERGGVSSRLGFAKKNGTPFSAGVVHNVYWSTVLSSRVTHAGKDLYLGDTNTSRKTFTTTKLVTFAELNGHVIACHPTDGLWTSTDGTTWTVVADADAPTTGTCVCTWQNKLFVGLPDGSIHWSNAGDPTAWTSTDFNEIWEKDKTAVVAMHIASGQDILGQAGLLVFKQESAYRVSDSTTGAYTTVDATVGAAGPIAVIGAGPKVVALSRQGVFWWADGVVGMQDGTDQFRPLWSSLQLNLAEQNLWCAGRDNNGRLRFSLTRTGSTANDLALRYHPTQGWCAPGSDAMSCYTQQTGTSGDTLYGGSPTVSGQVYTLDSGGDDDGAGIDWRLQTRWFDLAGGWLITIWQLRAHMRGAGTITTYTDYSTSGVSKAFDMAVPQPTYDSGLKYGSGVKYSSFVTQAVARFFTAAAGGACRQVSYKFSGTSTTTYTGPALLGGSVGRVAGSFGLFGLEIAYWWLGFDS